MRIALIAMVAVCLLGMQAVAAAPSKVQSKDGSFRLEAKTIMGGENRFVASGNAHLYTKDAAAKTTLEAEAATIVIVIASQGKAKSGMDIESAELTGPVKLVYCADENGVTTKTVATADSASFNGAAQAASLRGNVKITHDNPTIFVEPAVMAGDKATVNLAPKLDAHQYRFKVESETGLSTITATPKEKEKQKD